MIRSPPTQHQLDLALRDSDSAVQLQPGYVKALMRRGQLLEGQGHLEKATDDYRAVIEIDPQHREANASCLVSLSFSLSLYLSLSLSLYLSLSLSLSLALSMCVSGYPNRFLLFVFPPLLNI